MVLFHNVIIYLEPELIGPCIDLAFAAESRLKSAPLELFLGRIESPKGVNHPLGLLVARVC